jgi:hypothetical protein
VNRITVVEVPDLVCTDDAERDREIEEWLLANKEKWSHALDLETHYIDPRAAHAGDEIEDIDVVAGDITVNYTVSYSIYYGCDDMDVDEDDQRVIGGEYSDGKITFETPPPPEPRYPNEEL